MKCNKFFISLIALIASQVAGLERENVVGGQLTTTTIFPYTISIQVLGEHICGGGLIAPNFVLTAAHCIDLPDPKSPKVNSYTVVVKRSELNNRSVGEEIPVAKIYIPSKYDYQKQSQNYDIAVLKLLYNATEKYLDLPEENESFIGSTAFIASWGETESYVNFDGKLRYINVQIVMPEVCNLTYPASTLCVQAAYPDIIGLAQGDSGSPIEYNNKVVGVLDKVKIDELCTNHNCIYKNRRGIIAKVSENLPFIKGAMSDNKTSDTIVFDYTYKMIRDVISYIAKMPKVAHRHPSY